MSDNVHICDWSSAVEDLKKKDRTEENVLAILRRNPRISAFTMQDHYRWLQPILERLESKGLIKSTMEGYPWWRHDVVEDSGSGGGQ